MLTVAMFALIFGAFAMLGEHIMNWCIDHFHK